MEPAKHSRLCTCRAWRPESYVRGLKVEASDADSTSSLVRFQEHDVEYPGRARIAASVFGRTSRGREPLPLTEPPATRIAVKRRLGWRSRMVMFTAIFAASALVGYIASGLVAREPTASKSAEPTATPKLSEKAAAETWVLQHWLPTELALPHRATTFCHKVRSEREDGPAALWDAYPLDPREASNATWSCHVRQTRTDKPLLQGHRPSWTVRLRARGHGFRVLEVTRLRSS
jgi:hypothetical protein